MRLGWRLESVQNAGKASAGKVLSMGAEHELNNA